MKRIAAAVVTADGPNYRHRVETGGFTFATDEPVPAGGQNAGVAPYNLLLASLGSCTAITLKMYADRKGWNLGALRVVLALEKDAEGKTYIERTLESDAALSAEQWDRLIEIAGKTPVTRTLLTGASITTRRAGDG